MAHRSWRLTTTVDLRRFGSNTWKNSSPVTSQIPIQEVIAGQRNEWVMGAADDDVDPLTFSLGSASDMTGSSSDPLPHQAGASVWQVGSTSGVVAFHPPSPQNYLFCGMIKISDSYSEITVDFIMKTVQPRKYCKCTPRCQVCTSNSNCAGSCNCENNAAPVFIPPSPWVAGTGLPSCFPPGQTTTFTLGAADYIDTCDKVQVTSGDLPVGATITPQTSTPSNVKYYDFTWNPRADQSGSHRVTLVPRDDALGVGAPESISLYVPAASSLSSPPTISSWGPQSGESITATALTLDGSNFLRGPDLMCKFSYTNGAGSTHTILVRAVWLTQYNGNRVICAMPNEADLSQGNPSTSRQATVEVSNYASCDLWVNVGTYQFFDACPPGSFLSGPNCNACPLGRYQASGNAQSAADCILCPAGRYGAVVGLTSPVCSGECIAGYYCPPGSTASNANQCPAGRYGDSAGQQTDACSGLCDAGYYCPSGTINTNPQQLPCPAGRYGTPGESSSLCAGLCSAGYMCPAGSDSAEEQQCGAVTRVCPAGSGTFISVNDGFYSTGNTPTTRTDQEECEAGFYCSGGRRYQCPAGRYGDQRALTSNQCTGQCDGGFICPAGSTTPTAVQCGAAVSKPATVYCPPGSTGTSPVSTGFYSTPDGPNDDPKQRSGQAKCGEGESCVDGIRYKRVTWVEGCTNVPGSVTQATGNVMWSEHQAFPDLVIRAEQYDSGTAEEVLSYTRRIDPAPGCPPSSLSGALLDELTGPRRVEVTHPGGSAPIAVPNFEQCDKFIIEVTATTPGNLATNLTSFTSTCTIEVDIVDENDCPKLCSSTTEAPCTDNLDNLVPYELEENPAKATAVGGALHTVVVTDEDIADEVQYNITSITSNAASAILSDVFAMGSCSGQLSVATTVPSDFDYEALRDSTPGSAEPMFTLTVDVNDNAITNPCGLSPSPEVTVRIMDINEAPFFTQAPGSRFWIEENSATGASVTPNAPTVDDPDRYAVDLTWLEKRFSITGQDGSRFQIHASTGVVSLAGGTSLNFEALDSPDVALELRIADGQELGSVQPFIVEILDVNDAPVIPDGTMTVNENVPAGTIVGHVFAEDQEFNASAIGRTVMSWEIAGYKFGNMPGGANFTGVPPGFSMPFGIRPATAPGLESTMVGEVYTIDSVDFETLARYELTVRVTDNGLDMSTRSLNPQTYPAASDTAVITISVRNVNEAPAFDPPTTLTVNEEVSIPHALAAALQASDPDVGPGGDPTVVTPLLFFDFTGGATDFFGVDSSSGVVTAVQRLNFEAIPSHTLTARVTDGSLSSTTTITINVQDVNEAPVLTSGQVFTFAENTGDGHVVGTVSGTDVDAGDTVPTHHTFSFPNNTVGAAFFSIDAAGVLRTSVSAGVDTDGDDASFNFEGTRSMTFPIIIKDDGGLSSQGQVTVDLTNVNEAPVLEDFSFSTIEGAPSGTVLGSVFGSDVDIAASGDSLNYTMVATGTGSPGAYANCSTVFSASALSPAGLVQSTDEVHPLTGTSSPEWCNFTVTVTDALGLTDTALLSIAMFDDNQPVLIPPVQAFSIPETATVGTPVTLSLGASDADPAEFLVFTMSQTSPLQTGNAAFRVVPGPTCGSLPGGVVECEGSIEVAQPLDHEADETYVLTVRASDTNPTPASNFSIVTVTVTDVNEAPSIVDASTPFLLPETSAASHIVGQATRSDPDDPGMETQSWSSPNLNTGVFSLSVGGQISLVSAGAAIDYEQVQGYTFTMVVEDKGGLNDTQTMAIQIVDENEAPTVTLQPSASVSTTTTVDGDVTLFEGTPLATANVSRVQFGVTVATVAGRDPDVLDTLNGWGTLNYTITSGNSDNVWSIEAETANADVEGLIKLAAPELDYELHPSYNLGVRLMDGGGEVLDIVVNINVINTNDVHVSSMTGPYDSLNVDGGDTLTLTGSNLGMVSIPGAVIELHATGTRRPADSPPLRTFDPAVDYSESYVFPCVQTVTNTQINCTTVPGAAGDLAFELRVTLPGATEPDTLSLGGYVGQYRRPTITGVSGTHIGMNTRGGETVVLTGTQFPDLGEEVFVSYGPAGKVHKFHATACTVTTAFTAASCTTAPGVGGELSWTLASSAKWSPVYTEGATGSRYGAPQVTGVRVVSRAASFVPFSNFPTSVPDQVLDAEGGDVFVVSGSNFGEDLSADAAFVPIVKYFRLFGTGGAVVSTAMGDTGAPLSASAPAGAVAETGEYVYSAASCRVVVPHELIRCTSVVGGGQALSLQVTIAQQHSELLVGRNVTLHYRPPVITSISGEALHEARTEGGDLIYLDGQWLPAARDTRIQVTYGPSSNPARFTAQGCAVSVSTAQVRCLTNVGTGKDWVFAVTVVDQPIINQNGLFPTNHSYHVPVIANYTGAGASDAATQGGQEVILTGQHFGPLGSDNIDKVEYQDEEQRKLCRADPTVRCPPIFQAVNCSVTVAHTQVSCMTGPGAGSGLRWELTIDGLLSSDVTTSYESPTLVDFMFKDTGVAFSSGGVLAHSQGGQSLILNGSNFGPDFAYQMAHVPLITDAFLDWVRMGPSSQLGSDYYEVKDCVVVSHDSIECTSRASTGGPYYWFVSVRGQVNEHTTSHSAFHYQSPHIDRLDAGSRLTEAGQSVALSRTITGTAPLRSTAADGEIIRIVGSGFGILDEFANHTVLFGDLEIPPSDMWYDAAEDKEVIEFVKPGGHGSGHRLIVRVSNLLSLPKYSNDLTFAYAAPDFTRFDFSLSTNKTAPGQLEITLRSGTGAFCQPPPGLAGATIESGDSAPRLSVPRATSSPLELCGQIFVDHDPPPGTDRDNNYMGSLPAYTGYDQAHPDWGFAIPRDRVRKWTPSEVVFWVAAAPVGNLTVTIGNQVGSVLFRDIAPALREGDCARLLDADLQTAGNTLPISGRDVLNITGTGLCSRDVSVSLRFSSTSFASSSQTTRECTPVDASDSRPTTVIGVEDGQNICFTRCHPPEGQGGDVTVHIKAGGMTDQRGCPVLYAKPSVSQVTMMVDASGAAIGSPRTVSTPFSVADHGAVSLYYPGVSTANLTLDTIPSAGRLSVRLPTAGGIVTLVGDNFGEDGFTSGGTFCAGSGVTSFALLRPRDTPPGPGDICLKAASVSLPHSHTSQQLRLPAGNAASVYTMAFGVGGYTGDLNYIDVRYEQPRVLAVQAASTGTDTIGTDGGVVFVTGVNFGDDESLLSVWFRAPGDSRIVNCGPVTLVTDHTNISCLLPPGVGQGLVAYVTTVGVDSVPNDPAAVINYGAPLVHSMWPTQWPTRAGTLVTITGENFLPESLPQGDLQALVLESPSVRHLSYMIPDPFNLGDAVAAPLHRGSVWVTHNSSFIQFLAPHVQGPPRDVVLHVGNQRVTLPMPVSVMPPVVTGQEPPTGPTKGYIVKLLGSNFGRRENVIAEDQVSLLSSAAGSFSYNVRVGGADAHVADLARLVVKVLDEEDGDVDGLRVLANVNGAKDDNNADILAPCRDVSTIWRSDMETQWSQWYLHRENPFDTDPPLKSNTPEPYTHEYYFCKLDPGFGRDNPLVLDVDGTGTVSTTQSFNTPYMRSSRPNTPDATGMSNWHLQGADFGHSSLDLPLRVLIGEQECTGLTLNTSNLLECDTPPATVGPKVVSITAAGYSNITFPNVSAMGSVTFQGTGVGSPTAAALIQSTLDANSNVTALDGAGRVLHPAGVAALLGATEGGFMHLNIRVLSEGVLSMSLTEVHSGADVDVDVSNLDGRRELSRAAFPRALQDEEESEGLGLEPGMYIADDIAAGRVDTVFKVQYHCQFGFYGQLGEECLPCPQGAECQAACLASSGSICTDFSEPESIPGWYSLDAEMGNPECGRSERPYPYNTTCFDLVPCEPAESCVGANECAPEYTGVRCSQCAERFYRVAGLCVACPDMAWLFITLFVVGLVVLCCVGYVLNRYKVHLAFISIGVDYFQVLGMFANARVEWPQFLRDLYRILSIFQINLDITAPECAIPDVKYAQKWFVIESLPLFLGAMLLLIYLVKTAFDRIMHKAAKHRGTHTPTLVAMGQLMMYYLYLLLTRTTFDAFNCQPTDPSDGKLYLEVDFIECYSPEHNVFFYPALFFALPAYTIAYPVFVYWHLSRNKDKVKTDQLLRAMGIGDIKSTNPHHSFRLMYHKLYYHFKPGKWYWLLAIIFRKFCIALTALLFRRTPSFQMAVAFLVLFFCFSLQVRHNPFMSMAERRGIILHHQSKVKEGNKKHQAIKAAYETALRNANDRQKARMRGNGNMEAVLKSKGSVQQDYLFDYNTMEAVLLACGCFVTLSGIMFQTGDDNSPIYQVQRQALTVLVAMVIFASLIYFFTVFGFELYTTFGGTNCQAMCASKSKADGKKGKPSGKQLKAAAMLDEELEGGGMQMNPMAMRATMRAERARLDEILKSDGVPSKAQWEMVREQAKDIDSNLAELSMEVVALKDSQEEARRASASTRGKNGKRRSILQRALGLNKVDEEDGPAGVEEVSAAVAASKASKDASVEPQHLSREAVVNRKNPMLARSGSFASPGASPAASESKAGAAAAGSPGATPKKKTRRASVALLASERGEDDATWGSWTRMRNAEGSVWYYNNDTAESTYDMPSGFDAEGFMIWDAEVADAVATDAATSRPDTIAEGDEEEE